jgi:hypothetical protein
MRIRAKKTNPVYSAQVRVTTKDREGFERLFAKVADFATDHGLSTAKAIPELLRLGLVHLDRVEGREK